MWAAGVQMMGLTSSVVFVYYYIAMWLRPACHACDDSYPDISTVYKHVQEHFGKSREDLLNR